MSKVIPVLGGLGWLTDPKAILEQMISHAIVCDYSQSNLFYGSITSLPYIIAEHQANPDKLVYELEKALTEYLSTTMNNVNVTASYKEKVEVIYEYEIFLSVSGFIEGEYSDLRLRILQSNGAILDVIKAING